MILCAASRALGSYTLLLGRTQPDHPAALNDPAGILATDPSLEIRYVPKAIRLAMHACELSAVANAAYLDFLETTFAEADQRAFRWLGYRVKYGRRVSNS